MNVSYICTHTYATGNGYSISRTVLAQKIRKMGGELPGRPPYLEEVPAWGHPGRVEREGLRRNGY